MVVDAVAGERARPDLAARAPGTEELPLVFGGRSSTHLLGLAEVLELARALGPAARRGSTVIGIEGDRFGLGARPSPAVEGARRAMSRRRLIAANVGADWSPCRSRSGYGQGSAADGGR